MAKPLDQAGDEIVRTGMGYVFHHAGHIHHRIALQHAQLEIIEIE